MPLCQCSLPPSFGSTSTSTSVLILNATGYPWQWCVLWYTVGNKPKQVTLVADTEMRVCRFCHGELQSTHKREMLQRERMQQEERGPPMIQQLAALIEQLILDCNETLPAYKELTSALLRCERIEQYEDAVLLRKELLRRCQKVGVEGKKMQIANMKVAKEKGKEITRTDRFKIRAMVAKRCTEFLQANMLGLPKLPKKEEIEAMAAELANQPEAVPEPVAKVNFGTIVVQVIYETGGLRGTQPIGQLILHVVEASNLVYDDKNGTNLCDPYVIARVDMGSLAPMSDSKKAGGDLEERTKTMKKTTNPKFDEELTFDEVGSIERIADRYITIEVRSGSKKKMVLIGRTKIPVGLALDLGEDGDEGLELGLQDPLSFEECIPWTPFSHNQLLALQFQQLDDMQRFSIVRSIASQVPFAEAMQLVQQFVGSSRIVRGTIADAKKAVKVVSGMRDIELLNPLHRTAVMDALTDGKMSIEAAIAKATELYHMQLKERQQILERSKAQQRTRPSEDDLYTRLRDTLRQLEPAQARPILQAVEEGTMAVHEAMTYVNQFVEASRAAQQQSQPVPQQANNPPDEEEEAVISFRVYKDEDGFGVAIAETPDKGIIVADLKPGGAAHGAGLTKGMVIVAINRKSTRNASKNDVMAVLQSSETISVAVVNPNYKPSKKPSQGQASGSSSGISSRRNSNSDSMHSASTVSRANTRDNSRDVSRKNSGASLRESAANSGEGAAVVQVAPQPSSMSVRASDVGRAVQVYGYEAMGWLRFFGQYHGDGKMRCGIELSAPLGKNNGEVGGKRYFECADKHGVMVIPEKMRFLPEDFVPGMTAEPPHDAGRSDNTVRTFEFSKTEAGFGMSIQGPKAGEESGAIFIKKAKETGPAFQCGVRAGMRILSLNGNNVRVQTQPFVVGILKSTTAVTLILDVSNAAAAEPRTRAPAYLDVSQIPSGDSNQDNARTRGPAYLEAPSRDDSSPAHARTRGPAYLEAPSRGDSNQDNDRTRGPAYLEAPSRDDSSPAHARPNLQETRGAPQTNATDHGTEAPPAPSSHDCGVKISFFTAINGTEGLVVAIDKAFISNRLNMDGFDSNASSWHVFAALESDPVTRTQLASAKQIDSNGEIGIVFQRKVNFRAGLEETIMEDHLIVALFNVHSATREMKIVGHACTGVRQALGLGNVQAELKPVKRSDQWLSDIVGKHVHQNPDMYSHVSNAAAAEPRTRAPAYLDAPQHQEHQQQPHQPTAQQRHPGTSGSLPPPAVDSSRGKNESKTAHAGQPDPPGSVNRPKMQPKRDAPSSAPQRPVPPMPVPASTHIPQLNQSRTAPTLTNTAGSEAEIETQNPAAASIEDVKDPWFTAWFDKQPEKVRLCCVAVRACALARALFLQCFCSLNVANYSNRARTYGL